MIWKITLLETPLITNIIYRLTPDQLLSILWKWVRVSSLTIPSKQLSLTMVLPKPNLIVAMIAFITLCCLTDLASSSAIKNIRSSIYVGKEENEKEESRGHEAEGKWPTSLYLFTWLVSTDSSMTL